MKEEIKLSLFKENMILYIENPREDTHTLLELINESFRYEIKIQKLLVFVCTNNWQSDNKVKKTSPFAIVQI